MGVEDQEILAMENDLMAHEVRFLRSRIAELERESRQERRVEHDRLRQLQKAESDLRWFVQRLGESPLGWAFRLWPGFRTLESRYLSD